MEELVIDNNIVNNDLVPTANAEGCDSDVNRSDVDNRSSVDDCIPEDDQLITLGVVVQQQKDMLDNYQRQLSINEHKYLTDIENLQSLLQSSNKMYDTAKQEKEAAFMRYVLKEKEVLDLNSEKKKLSDSLKERDKHISRLKANSMEVANFMNVIETKNKEIKEYKVFVESLKDEKTKTSKELEVWKTKYEQESLSSRETESKLLHEIHELQTKLESLTVENESFNEEGNLERIVLNSKLYLDSNKCSEQQLQEIDRLKCVIEELTDKLTECMCSINSLDNENIDLKTHMKSCEIKTNELLVFSENLSSRNASLQSDYNNLQTALDKLKSDCDILKQKNTELKIAFDAQKDNITKEKELYDCDKKKLASHLAQKIQTIIDLKIMLERTQDDLHVSKRKFKTTVTELTKELQKKNDTSVEMKIILDKMVKLQQEKARICEKLDLIEDYNRNLACKLKTISKTYIKL